MDFLSIAQNRYTTKKYDPEKKVSEENIKKLKEILRLCPSSINSQPWTFIFISDKKLKNRLAEVSHFNEHKIEDASHIIVFNVLDDVEKFEKEIVPELPESTAAYYRNVVKPNGVPSIKAWFARQVYLSLGYFLSACACMEIDSTPMEGIDVEEYAKILEADAYKPLFAVAIGYRDPQDTNQPSITPKSRLDIKDIIKTI